MDKQKIIIGSSIILLALVFGNTFGFSSAAKDEDLELQVYNLEKLIAITSEAYQLRAEDLRAHRSHCSMAEEIEGELADMTSTNATRRRQIKLLRLLSPKVTAARQ